ncbi:MAG: ATP-dependent helicase [bacterium JZ-2024 1]
MSRTDEILSALDEDQRAVCEIIEGPVAVIAGPGSGKTRVLTHRIAYMIARGIPSRSILAITFTNKAAEEMKSRLSRLIKAEGTPFVSTFHAAGAHFLRHTADAFGLTHNFSIYDEDDSRAVIKSVRASFADKHLARLSNEGIAIRIENAKRAGHLPEDLPTNDEWEEHFKSFYAAYQEALIARNAVDFGDLILYPLRLFVSHPERMAPFAERFRFILVDEFQDIDASQYSLLRHLVKDHNNVFVVGDQDQSIYGFRGADPAFLEKFVADFPGVRVMYLERNYRSQPAIVKAATEIARCSPFSFKKNLRSACVEDHIQDRVISFVETSDEIVQSEDIARRIEHLIASGVPASQIAVLYRVHHLSTPIEYALARRKIPYCVLHGFRFFQRKVVKDAVSFLRVVVNPQDVAAWERICARPPRGIGEKTMAEIARLLAHLKADPIHSGDDGARFPASFQSLCQIIRNAVAQNPADLSALFWALVRDTGYLEWLQEREEAEEGLAHLEALEKLLARANEEHKSLAQFLQDLTLWSEQDAAPESERVQLMTFHAAKGLEFHTVFMPDLVEEILPHRRALESGIGLDEERRLFYVGLTRAKNAVFLYRPIVRARYSGSRTQKTTSSRYLTNLPRELVHRWYVQV